MGSRFSAHSSAGKALWLGWAFGALAMLTLLIAGSSRASADAVAKQGKSSPVHKGSAPLTDQVLYGFPLTITVEDSTQMQIQYTNPQVDQNASQQFFGSDAEGVYLWVIVNGATQVFGPQNVPAGNGVNPYNFVSNTTTGSGSPSSPWLITTVVDVPGANLRLTQRTNYVNGAEFIALHYDLQQIGGSQPVTATLFHAADLYTGGSDQGYGYYDDSSGGVGDYYTPTNRALYQQFVPSTPASQYQESNYHDIWDRIGSTTGPGDGFNNTIISDTLHDAGAGLQWNLTVPASGSVTVGDTDLFSPHAALCGSFSDVHFYDFYYDYIYYLACHGIVSGYADTTYRPQNNVTRGQLSKIVSLSAGFNEPPAGQTFEDVPPTSPFYPYVQRMSGRGYIGGYACGGTNPDTHQAEPCVAPTNRPYFRYGSNGSRGQITKIISNAAGFSDPATGQTFTDVALSSPFYQWVQRLTSRTIMGGYTCGGTNPDTGQAEPCDGQSRPYFRPASNATRAQTAKIDARTFFPTCCP
ncbi:MAG: S-layer homology domain-containing protein [Chloroflexota bacterium]|nr:S-layer homology domain-containing protein [Chloroflexota bacterium]